MDVTAESVISLYENAKQIVGLRFSDEPEYLRFFQARFEPMRGAIVLRGKGQASRNGDSVLEGKVASVRHSLRRTPKRTR
jgi:hypothetical protein